MTTVVALGGNALVGPGDRGTAAEQLVRLRETVQALAPLLDGPLVLTHGNGPQVGNALRRQERAADEVPPLPLWLAVATTQAEIGSLAVLALQGTSSRAATCVLTHAVVDPADPAFADPTKPIGPFYDAERSEWLQRERGWSLVEVEGRGWRRTVSSPRPLELLEVDAIRALCEGGATVIACGGGGIPVVRRADGRLSGVEAVVDKDHASALLATALAARRLVILTDVDAVQRDFGTPGATGLDSLTADEAERLAAEAQAGSMRPKLEAAAAFARAMRAEALVTSAAALGAALAGDAGTTITPG